MTHDDRHFIQQLIETQTQQFHQHLNIFSDNIDKKIDGVTADLKAHRADTEAHHGVYQVKEG